MLAKLPNAPATVHEDTTTHEPDTSPPRQADVVLVSIQVGNDGHLKDKDAVVPKMLYAGVSLWVSSSGRRSRLRLGQSSGDVVQAGDEVGERAQVVVGAFDRVGLVVDEVEFGFAAGPDREHGGVTTGGALNPGC
jgi:hypothetical protein